MKISASKRAVYSSVAILAVTALLAADAQGGIKFGFVNKMGDHPWFVAEVAGAKTKAKSLGVDLAVQNVAFDANLTITTVDTMIADGVKGIAIVVPDRSLGPVIAEKAAKAGVMLIAVDDDIKTKDGKDVPYVGMNALKIGNQVGAEIAKLYKMAGWGQSSGDVRIASIEDQKADTCMRRNQGARESFLAAVPNFPKNQILSVPYDNTIANAIDVMSTTLTANPNVKHWIFWSCNDDGVLGAVRATENARISNLDVIGIGIDGSRTCEAYKAGKPSGFRGSIYLDSAQHGELAIQLLYNAVVNKKPLPLTTYSTGTFITQANFATMKDKVGCK